MVRAAARGTIDFSQADPRSRAWRRKVTWLVEEEARSCNLEYLAAARDQLQAVIGISNLSADILPDYIRDLEEKVNRVHRYLFPWVKEKPVESERAAVADAWTATFGDPNDPVVKARLDEVLAWFEDNQRRPPRNDAFT